MNLGEIKAIVENILLAAGEPVTMDRLAETFQNGVPRKDVQQVLKDLKKDYADKNLQIQEVADGFQLSTRMEYSDWIKKYLHLDKATRLSQPALDTLSIIAYKQPITRAEVEEIRGVDPSGVIKTLLEKNIVGQAGRKKVLGRPMMYRTTRKFLEYFGLKDLSDMPTLEDFKETEISGDSHKSSRQEKFPFIEPDSRESSNDKEVKHRETSLGSTGDESENI